MLKQHRRSVWVQVARNQRLIEHMSNESTTNTHAVTASWADRRPKPADCLPLSRTSSCLSISNYRLRSSWRISSNLDSVRRSAKLNTSSCLTVRLVALLPITVSFSGSKVKSLKISPSAPLPFLLVNWVIIVHVNGGITLTSPTQINHYQLHCSRCYCPTHPQCHQLKCCCSVLPCHCLLSTNKKNIKGWEFSIVKHQGWGEFRKLIYHFPHL